MATLKLAVFAACIFLVRGCAQSQVTGLLASSFTDSGMATLVLTNRTVDTDPSNNDGTGVVDYKFTNAINIFQDDTKNFWIRVFDNGILAFAPTKAGLPTQPAQSTLASIDSSQAFAIAIADSIKEGEAGVNYTVDSYYMLRSDQFDSGNLPVGPSICDLQRVAAIISDCISPIRNTTILEALVVTWKIEHSTNQVYYFQAIVAIDSNKHTYIAFLYESHVVIAGVNEVAKGEVHCQNDGLTSYEVRLAEICNAETDPFIHRKSNCICSEEGHYVFQTDEMTTAPHGFCGNGTNSRTCASQASIVDDGTNVNRNCRASRTPLDTCDVSYFCTRTSVDNIDIFIRDTNKNRASFFNYTIFVNAGGATVNNDTVQLLDGTLIPGPCTFSFANIGNETFNRITITVSSSTCVTYDSATNSIKFGLYSWDSNDGFQIYSDGSKLTIGSCDLDDLPSKVNVTVPVLDVFRTTVPAKTGQSLRLVIWDRQDNSVTPQVFGSTTVVSLGRLIFFVVMFTPGAPFEADVDVYGVYVHSVWICNNPECLTGGTNRAKMLIDADGCVAETNPNAAGYLIENFKERSNQTTPPNPFLAVSGGLETFRWSVGETKLYVTAAVRTCRNTELFRSSKCNDPCNNTIVDSNVTMTRRKRQIEDGEQILTAEITVVDVTETTTPPSRQNCTDPVMAKSVIGALVALLIIATLMTTVLFCMLQTKKKKL